MKKNIHPEYKKLAVTCSCGHTFETCSTLNQPKLHIERCMKCHPFSTGEQKIVASKSTDRFKQRYSAYNLLQVAKNKE